MRLKATDEFFDALGKMIDRDSPQGFHKCRDCGVADGCHYERKGGKRLGERSKAKAIVRLCLIDPDGKADDVSNVGYYCTRCRKGPRTVRSIPKSVRDKMPRLFP